jgi:hypothetical protein
VDSGVEPEASAAKRAALAAKRRLAALLHAAAAVLADALPAKPTASVSMRA